MVTRFNEAENHRHARPVQVWQILVSAASNRQTLTYGQLAEYMGYQRSHARAVIPYLNIVGEYCQQHRENGNLPMLPVIVVNQGAGLPGEGILKHIFADELELEREQVYDYDWFMIVPPSAEAFAEAHRQAGK